MVWFAFTGLLIMTIAQVVTTFISPIGWSRKGDDAGTVIVKTLFHLLILSFLVASLVLIGGLL